jgi:phosphoribosyl-ATP pyrophosphohydrolase
LNGPVVKFIACATYAGQIAGMDQQHPIDRLYQRIGSRQNSDTGSSYTASLLAKGTLECAKKLGEEAIETALAAGIKDDRALIRESADLLYHLLVLWVAAGIKPADVYAELRAREVQSGLQEKAARDR